MNLDEAILNLRGRLDDEVAPYLWSNTDFISYLNQRRNEFARRTKYFVDSSTSAICTLTMGTSTANYALDERIVEILRAKPSWATVPLKRRSIVYMDAYNSGWQDASTSTQPYIWIPDKDEGYFTIWPTPASAVGTVTLTVARLPLTQYSLSLLNLATPTVMNFPLMWQENLLDGVMASAYAKPDSQTRNPEKAREYELRWEKFLMVDVVQHMTKTRQSEDINPDEYSINRDGFDG